MAPNVEQLTKAKELLAALIKEKNCGPILIRLAWHDSGTHDASVSEWPKCGGADGSIRFAPEINHGANKGLAGAVALITPIKEQVPEVSWADLIQMSSALSIELMGGPKIPMRYGRVDVESPEQCPAEGNLPAAKAPFPKDAKSPAQHLRDVFHRMGLTDQDIVALSGAHTVGRAFSNRSGANDKPSTKYTENAPTGTQGGQSWTAEWLKFDNAYFADIKASARACLAMGKLLVTTWPCVCFV